MPIFHRTCSYTETLASPSRFRVSVSPSRFAFAAAAAAAAAAGCRMNQIPRRTIRMQCMRDLRASARHVREATKRRGVSKDGGGSGRPSGSTNRTVKMIQTGPSSDLNSSLGSVDSESQNRRIERVDPTRLPSSGGGSDDS
jgi:hypothetical protein